MNVIWWLQHKSWKKVILPPIKVTLIKFSCNINLTISSFCFLYRRIHKRTWQIWIWSRRFDIEKLQKYGIQSKYVRTLEEQILQMLNRHQIADKINVEWMKHSRRRLFNENCYQAIWKEDHMTQTRQIHAEMIYRKNKQEHKNGELSRLEINGLYISKSCSYNHTSKGYLPLVEEEECT